MGTSRRVRSRGTRPLASVLALLWAIFGGCAGTSSKPLGAGDDLVVDVDATPAPPDPHDIDDASTADSPFGFLDGPYGYGSLAPDSYAPLAACEQCACASGSYCFGGGTGLTVSSATCGQPVDAGGAALEVGCVPLPAGCENEPDCPCLLQALADQLACAPVCVEVSGFAVYCPVP
jgi:hypothetical protein